MPLTKLLSLMADGSFHSGRELGEALGVSRSAVWKQIQRIEALGIEVYSVKGRGYRIPTGLDLLSLERFNEQLSPTAGERLEEVVFEGEVASTNILALQSLSRGCRSGLFAAEYQAQGRGRRGRDWISPYGANLCFSLAWRFSAGVAALEGLSLAVGVALRRGLARVGVNGVQLKWPNDLLSEGRKLAGILIEISGDAAGECRVVIGVGVNVLMPAAVADQVSQPFVDVVSLTDSHPGRSALLAVLVEELLETLDSFERDGFGALREEWQQANAHRDSRIRLISGQDEIDGICRGVDESGALLLESDGQVRSYYGGEVSLRAAE